MHRLVNVACEVLKAMRMVSQFRLFLSFFLIYIVVNVGRNGMARRRNSTATDSARHRSGAYAPVPDSLSFVQLFPAPLSSGHWRDLLIFFNYCSQERIWND